MKRGPGREGLRRFAVRRRVLPWRGWVLWAPCQARGVGRGKGLWRGIAGVGRAHDVGGRSGSPNGVGDWESQGLGFDSLEVAAASDQELSGVFSWGRASEGWSGGPEAFWDEEAPDEEEAGIVVVAD